MQAATIVKKKKKKNLNYEHRDNSVPIILLTLVVRMLLFEQCYTFSMYLHTTTYRNQIFE